jgi:putative ABC transport system permease protein
VAGVPRGAHGFERVVLGAVALSLTIIGLYGATAFSVQARMREIGIRLAIGATRRDVLRLFVRQCLGMLTAGLILGLIAAAAMTRLVASILYGVNATDGLSFAAAAVVVSAATLVAVIVPARRAASAKPFDALRTCE